MKLAARWAPAGLLLIAAGVVLLWLKATGGEELGAALRSVAPGLLPLLVAVTAACVFVRFLRWQFLLRRLSIRLPTRRSLSIYLASLTGILTPGYVGETIRCALIRAEFGVPFTLTVRAWIAERALDAAAIALLTLLAASARAPVLLGLLFVAAAAALLGARRFDPALGVGEANPPRRQVRLLAPGVLLPALGLSIAAWAPASLLIFLTVRGMGETLDAVEGVRIFGTSTLGGALSLMPAGMATTGSLAILQLEAAGLALAHAVAAVSLFRLATVGVTLATGAAFLPLELRRRTQRAALAPQRHFDEIAEDYLRQFSPHMWELLLERRVSLLASSLGPPNDARLGLDLGCGLGLQANAVRERGFSVIGVDPAFELVRRAGRRGAEAVAGDAVHLPFADDAFDFVYTIGVLHHIPTRDEQRAACAEVARVLKPGGLFLVQETNPRNPLFRVYMGYFFPILRRIDEGTELWIDPADWERLDGTALEHTRYFTFLPDFLPRPLLRMSLRLEQALERGAFRRYSAHYMAVLRKRASAGSVRRETARVGATA